jgi:alkylation response protein AidB-like acyl-CoA dehydrogenase
MNVQYRPAFEAPRHDAEGLIARTMVLATILSEAAGKADASASIASETWQALHGSGLPMAPFPAAMGGEDLLVPGRQPDLFRVLRLVGCADLSLGRLIEGHINAVALVCRYGDAAQVGALAGAIADGGLAGVWGADDAAGLRIVRHDQGWRLTGRKIMASGAGFVARPVITAGTEAGPVMLLPRLAGDDRADRSGWTAQGMRSTATGSVDFTGMVLGADQILGEPGDFMRQPHFSGGAWRFCAVHLGGAERLVDLLRDHLVSRGRDADPYQVQRVAHCAAATTTAAFWIAEAARRMALPAGDAVQTVAFVNMTRMVTERAALDVLEAVHRGVGLQAFLRPHPIERIARDLATYLRQPVPDLAMADAGRFVLASPNPIGDVWSLA